MNKRLSSQCRCGLGKGGTSIHEMGQCPKVNAEVISKRIRPVSCECDNTHEQNNTCCQPCWNAGFRTVSSWLLKRIKEPLPDEPPNSPLEKRLPSHDDVVANNLGRLVPNEVIFSKNPYKKPWEK